MKNSYAVAYLLPYAVTGTLYQMRERIEPLLRRHAPGYSAIFTDPYCPVYEFDAYGQHEAELARIVSQINSRLSDARCMPSIRFPGVCQVGPRIGLEIDRVRQIPQAHRLALHECSDLAIKPSAEDLERSCLPGDQKDSLLRYGCKFSDGTYHPYLPMFHLKDGISIKEKLKGLLVDQSTHANTRLALLRVSEIGAIERIFTEDLELAASQD